MTMKRYMLGREGWLFKGKSQHAAGRMTSAFQGSQNYTPRRVTREFKAAKASVVFAKQSATWAQVHTFADSLHGTGLRGGAETGTIQPAGPTSCLLLAAPGPEEWRG